MRQRDAASRMRHRLFAGIARCVRTERSFEFIRRGEHVLKSLQGKGTGAFSFRDEARAIVPLLPAAGAVVLDIGANRGQWTLALLDYAGPSIRRLFMFEPASANQSVLHRVCKRREGIELITAAVSDSNGSGLLHSPTPGAGTASLHPRSLRVTGLRSACH
jgi:hypothetical protein